MKKKNLFILLITIMLCVSFLVPSAWAGSKQRYRWEGVAIGIGAAILGSALLSNLHHPPARLPHQPRPCLVPVFPCPPPPYRVEISPTGHWEMIKRWVPPRYERIWVEGYYDRYYQWVPGHWEERYKPGYWIEKKVWVAENRW